MKGAFFKNEKANRTLLGDSCYLNLCEATPLPASLPAPLFMAPLCTCAQAAAGDVKVKTKPKILKEIKHNNLLIILQKRTVWRRSTSFQPFLHRKRQIM